MADRLCHKHELTHAVFYHHYPKAHRLIHEGLAAFLDSDSVNKYQIKEHLNKIKKIKDADDLSDLLQTDTDFYYTLGRHILKAVFDGTSEIGDPRRRLRTVHGGFQSNGIVIINRDCACN